MPHKDKEKQKEAVRIATQKLRSERILQFPSSIIKNGVDCIKRAKDIYELVRRQNGRKLTKEGIGYNPVTFDFDEGLYSVYLDLPKFYEESDKFCWKQSSYGIKHILEDLRDDKYLSNGELIMAALLHGYTVQVVGESCNATLRIRLKKEYRTGILHKSVQSIC